MPPGSKAIAQALAVRHGIGHCRGRVLVRLRSKLTLFRERRPAHHAMPPHGSMLCVVASRPLLQGAKLAGGWTGAASTVG